MTIKSVAVACAALLAICSCTMNNPLLKESPLPYEAPEFDKIKISDYMPAFRQGIREGKAEIDAIVSNPEAPTFANTVEALERSGRLLDRVSSLFYNIKEADTSDEMDDIAEKLSPMLTEYSMYISLNEKLFERIKAVYDGRDSLGLDQDQKRILEKTYKGFVRSGALLSAEEKERYGKLEEKLSLLTLKFSRNSLSATNAFDLNITDEADLAGLPQFVRDMGAAAAVEKGQTGWTFDLSAPLYRAFMQYSEKRDLRKALYMAYNTRAVGGEFDNTGVCRDIAAGRIESANILGYKTFADYQIEDRMVGNVDHVRSFMKELMDPSLPAARKEIADIEAYAKQNGFEGDRLESWDFSFWSNKYKEAFFSLNDEMLKPYFQLEHCIDAVFGLASTLYGISFEARTDIPVYHPDVKVFDVKDTDGRHLALFYCDFFPRPSKRGGAWMTEFSSQNIDAEGVEHRPLVSIVTNFSKPAGDTPSLLTHDELTTFLHEFGHSLHGIFSEGRYSSIAGTNVDHDFVELPSQIMENWAYESEWLKSFAKHYQNGEAIPDALIEKIVASRNYLAAYGQVRQLHFGTIDMAWHTLTAAPELGTVEFEKAALAGYETLPDVEGTCSSTSFSHIFAGGYAAGYYSYKWAEVLEADAYSLFQEKGIFSREVAGSFRENILSKGSLEDEAVLYRRFRGHDPETKSLLVKLGIIR